MHLQKAPVPPVECPVCNIQLSSQQVYVTHVEGKAHKKKLIQREKEKLKWKGAEKIEKEEIATSPKIIPKPIPSKGITDNRNMIVDSNISPTSSDNTIRNLTSSSAESIIIQPSLPAKKKKKNKVNQFIFML